MGSVSQTLPKQERNLQIRSYMSQSLLELCVVCMCSSCLRGLGVENMRPFDFFEINLMKTACLLVFRMTMTSDAIKNPAKSDRGDQVVMRAPGISDCCRNGCGASDNGGFSCSSLLAPSSVTCGLRCFNVAKIFGLNVGVSQWNLMACDYRPDSVDAPLSSWAETMENFTSSAHVISSAALRFLHTSNIRSLFNILCPYDGISTWRLATLLRGKGVVGDGDPLLETKQETVGIPSAEQIFTWIFLHLPDFLPLFSCLRCAEVNTVHFFPTVVRQSDILQGRIRNFWSTGWIKPASSFCMAHGCLTSSMFFNSILDSSKACVNLRCVPVLRNASSLPARERLPTCAAVGRKARSSPSIPFAQGYSPEESFGVVNAYS